LIIILESNERLFSVSIVEHQASMHVVLINVTRKRFQS
jgi:hypothetical protein